MRHQYFGLCVDRYRHRYAPTPAPAPATSTDAATLGPALNQALKLQQRMNAVKNMERAPAAGVKTSNKRSR